MIKHTLVGLALDAVDWLGLGLIPILADAIDLVGTVYFTKVVGLAGLAGLIELIPLADVLPTYTALGIYADLKARKT